MPSTKVKARTKRFNATYWASKKSFLKWELVGMRPDMDLDDLVLTWDGGRPLDVVGAISSLTVNRTIEGASTITMTILDPKGHLFSEKAGRTVHRLSANQKRNKFDTLTDERGNLLDAPTLQGRAVELTLDDVPFRLTKVSGDDLDGYTLVFEDRIIYWLRRKKGAKSASRASNTRAQFLLSLIREIKTESIPVICPELFKSQPQAKPDVDDALSRSLDITVMVDPPLPDVYAPNRGSKPKNTDDDTPTKKKSLKNVAGLTVKGKPANRDQKRNMDEVLEQAWSERGATKRSVKAVVLTVITEAKVENPDDGLGTSKGMFQVESSTAHALDIDPMDISDCVHVFMTKGFTGEGGAIKLAKDHTDWPAYRIAQHVQGSGEGRPTEGRKNYGPWMDEADKWLEAWSGGATSVDESGGQYRKSYQYQRDADENSWDCSLRLVDEVQWREFPVGRAMFIIDEIDLFRREISETVHKGDYRVLSFPWEMDWNKATNECTMRVVLDNWSAYPGCNIMVQDYGLPDGRWLVTELERDWFGNFADLTIKQPMTPKKEPAADIGDRTTGVSGEGTKGDIGKLYNICKHITLANNGYEWGGGHSKDLSTVHGYDGLDCSSSCSLALWRADLWDKDLPEVALTSGQFNKWGSPGSGHLFTVMYNNSHVWIQFEEAAGMMYKRFDTSAHGDGVSGDGPNLRKTARKDQGSFQKRHWPGM